MKKLSKVKKKNLFSKVIIVVVILLNIWAFTKSIEVIELTNKEPTTTITAWFAFTTGELWMLKDIKKTKVKKEPIKPIVEEDDEEEECDDLC